VLCGGPVVGARNRAARSSATQDADGAALGAPTAPSSGPSPASGTLGGVAAKTRRGDGVLCEAAGLSNVVLGGDRRHRPNRKTAVCDNDRLFFLALDCCPAPADELQGIKKGLVETRRHDRDQQGRRRTNIKRANLCGRRISRARCISSPPRSEHWHPSRS